MPEAGTDGCLQLEANIVACMKYHISGQTYLLQPQVYQQDGKLMRSFDLPTQIEAAAEKAC